MICRVIPYEGNEPYIFLSYCHKDSAVVYPLFEKMVQDGYRVWYDNGNNAGDDWPENIAEHLERSHICLAFVSEQSSISHNCKTEISFAIECHKKLVPVFIENFSMPKGMRMQLSSLHYLKKNDFPSDSALLNKVYEADSFQDCKGSPGDLQLKSPEKPEPAPPIKPDPRLIRSLSAPPSPTLEERAACAEAATPNSGVDPSAAQAPAPVLDDKPAATQAAASVQLSVGKMHLKVKPVFLKKKTKPHPQIPSAPDPAPEPTPEPPHTDPVPEPAPKPIHTDPVPPRTNIQQRSEGTGFTPSDPSDLTEVSSEEYEGEPTVYENDLDDKTVRDHYYQIDDGKTVRGNSTNIALLLQPSLQKFFLLKGPQTKIGRHPAQCDVVIEGNSSVSKHHANIIQSKQKFYLSDEGSSNGTFLNGEQLESKKQVLLDNPAIFQLNDETLILISGLQAKKLIQKGSVSLLINEAGTALRIMESDSLPLNRNNVWPDGQTLKDTTVHRAAHAQLCKKEDGIYLVDESPQNGTYLNESRLKHGEARKLTSGDRIRLGNNTILEFVMIALKENK